MTFVVADRKARAAPVNPVPPVTSIFIRLLFQLVLAEIGQLVLDPVVCFIQPPLVCFKGVIIFNEQSPVFPQLFLQALYQTQG